MVAVMYEFDIECHQWLEKSDVLVGGRKMLHDYHYSIDSTFDFKQKFIWVSVKIFDWSR